MSTAEAKVPQVPTAQSSGVLEEKCTKCGKEAHTRKECQAIGNKCNKCNKKNHFEDLCRNAEAPPKKPVAPKSSKQNGQEASKNQTVQHQTKAVQQPSKAAPPKTVQPSSGSKPEAQKPTDATPAAAQEKPVLTLKIGDDVAIKRKGDENWVKGGKIVNVEENHYVVKLRNGQSERVFHRYVVPRSAFDKFGNLKPRKVREAQAAGYLNPELVLEFESHVRVRDYDGNFTLEGTLAGRAGDYYLIAYPDGSSSWEHHRFVKSVTCSVNPELDLNPGTLVVARDGETKIWNIFGTVEGVSGNHYLVKLRDSEEVLKVHYHFVKSYSAADEKSSSNKTKKESAATETKYKERKEDQKAESVNEEPVNPEMNLENGADVFVRDPLTKLWNIPGTVVGRKGNHYLIHIWRSMWDLVINGGLEKQKWEYYYYVKEASLVNEKGYLKKTKEGAAATGTKAEERMEDQKAESVNEEPVNPELTLENGAQVFVRDSKTKLWNLPGTVVDRKGNRYLIKWIEGDQEKQSWEHYYYVKEASLVNENGYLKKTKEEAAATGTKAKPVVQKEKFNEILAVGTPVWIWNPETRDYSKWGTIVKYQRGQYLIESESGKWGKTQTWEYEGSVYLADC